VQLVAADYPSLQKAISPLQTVDYLIISEESLKSNKRLFYRRPSHTRFNIKVLLENEVVKINAKSKFVMVKDLKTSIVSKYEYDKLVLSPGPVPIVIELYETVFDITNILSKMFSLL
jgi:NADH dehydrogenase FAD-containing subunit